MGPDEAYEDFDVEELTPTGRKWQFAHLVVHVLVLIANIFADFGRLFAGVADDVCDHANYKSERERFAADAGRELETLIEGPKED